MYPLILVAIALLAAPLAAAQPATTPTIGYLGNGTPEIGRATRDAFLQGLRERDWVDGKTVRIEFRWAGGDPERLPALVAELVRAKVDAIVLAGPPAIRAGRAATSTIPIVFVTLADPIGSGFVASLGRPGGNLTGLAAEYEELITKQLELLKEVLPRLLHVALLDHHAETAASVLSAAETAAGRLGLKARVVKLAAVGEFETALRSARSEGVDAIHVLPSPFFNAHRRRLIDLAARHRLPAVYEFKDYVEDGGLMSYGPSITAMFRGMAGHVDRILRGARPGDLPIERPTEFELAINLRTARALGVSIPQSVLARADHVIP